MVHDLWQWGAQAKSEVERIYGPETVEEATRKQVIVSQRLGGLYIFMLSGKKLREYGITVRYKYVPARGTLVGTLLLRQAIHELEREGWANPTPYRGYSNGYQNIATMQKGEELKVVIGRENMSRRTLYYITDHFLKDADLKPGSYLLYVNKEVEAELADARRFLEDRNITITVVTLKELKVKLAEDHPPRA